MSAKTSPKDIKGIRVGIGYELTTNIKDFQIDAMALMLDQSGKLVSDKHFIFYNNLKSPDNSVEHLGNVVINTKDSAEILVDTLKIANIVKRIIFFVNVTNADTKNQSFDSVKNLYISFTNLKSKEEIAAYIPEKDSEYQKSNLIVLAELVLIGNEWDISALGECFKINLTEFVDILTNNYSYDNFKLEYLKSNRNNNQSSVKNIIEQNLEDSYYKVLDSAKNNTDEEIKKKYKELVKSFHPDIIQTKNLHKDIVEFANKRFKEIKEAYEFIKAKRNFH